MSGRWQLVVIVCLTAVPVTLLAQAGAPIVHRGALASGDQQLHSGEYYDSYEFQGRAGQRVVFDLTSTAFDPYLMVIAPSGHRDENDDYRGSNTRSRLELALEETGTYRVVVTSYTKDETGAYELRIGPGGPAAAEPGVRTESGRLAAGDATLRTGEYVDAYTFDGRPGQRVTVDVESNDFDTYLMLIPPRGDRWENDDVEGKPHHSVIEADLTEPGQYRVAVTSYKRGE